jgi:hypothetical protein
MAHTEIYGSYEIRWLETGEQFVALVRVPGVTGPPAVIYATVTEGMAILKHRTLRIIDSGEIGIYRAIT